MKVCTYPEAVCDKLFEVRSYFLDLLINTRQICCEVSQEIVVTDILCLKEYRNNRECAIVCLMNQMNFKRIF